MSKSQLINKMQQEMFYFHPIEAPIKVIQTHCSIVFLTGKYAYKLKKDVNFGFLDYSTLEKRKYFLEQELEMNRVIAPELYLEVLPISYSNDTFILNSDVNVVDYVLKMNQFPQENLFINIFESGKLTKTHIKQLGIIVANFHKTTITNDYIRSFGKVEKIALSINDNYRQTEKYIDVVQTLQQYQETKVFTDNFLINHQHIFEKRVITQKIRECHGDLHLKNICIFNDKIQLFDRIEFNEEFRFVDVMYDVAFTVMDLHSKGEEKLANIFLNTYLEYTGDWEGVMVLPLYLSRQAYVRAKVTSFLLDDLSVDKEEKEKAKQTAKDYYNLAWKYTKKNRAKLILMSGLSGSGKSTVACKMAQELNGIHIRSDAVRKHLAQIALQEKGTNDIYSPEMNDKTYGRLLELAQLLINAGFTVILDAKYDRISLRKPVVEWTKNQQIPLEIVYCHAPFSVMCDRISQRQGDISDATPEILKKQQEQLELFTEEEKPLVTKINTYD